MKLWKRPGGWRHIHKHLLSQALGLKLVSLPNTWKYKWSHIGGSVSPGNRDTSISTLILGSESKTLSGT